MTTFGTVSTAEEYDYPVSGEYVFDMSATQARVNPAGGLTVDGEGTCASATVNTALEDAKNLAVLEGFTEATYAALEDPAGGVYASRNWVATQYVGRTKVVTARYDSAIAWTCYDPQGTPPYEWATEYPAPVGGVQWIYSDNGKFTAGRIHIELQNTAVATIIVYDASEPPNELTRYTAVFYNTSGWDLRAVRDRTR